MASRSTSPSRLVSGPGHRDPRLAWGGGQLLSVSCTDAADCTAVGVSGGPIYVTKSAGIWGTPTEIPGSPSGNGQLLSVSCTDAADCTAVGYAGGPIYVTKSAGILGPPTVIPARFFANGQFQSVSCTDATDCTAVGERQHWPAVLCHRVGWYLGPTHRVPRLA